jgi:hypothetical protein
MIWERDVQAYKVTGSRIYDTNGTSLSWSIGTISPNIQGQMDKAQLRGVLCYCLEERACHCGLEDIIWLLVCLLI